MTTELRWPKILSLVDSTTPLFIDYVVFEFWWDSFLACVRSLLIREGAIRRLA